MAERKLNLNAPLLSARRYATPPRSSAEAMGKRMENSQPHGQHNAPSDRSDVNLDQVTEPVAVPFYWEKIPGTAKDGSTAKSRAREEGSVTPKIPPGKLLDVVKHREEKKFQDKSMLRPQVEPSSFSNKVNEIDYSKERVTEKEGLDSLNDDDDDGEDVYSDALDRLSPTDTRSMNCSEGGLSGFEGPAIKASGTFSADSHTRDFMMRRFLPAAKAMTLESPHYTSRKQSPQAVDLSKQITKVVSGDRTRTLPPTRCDPVSVPNNHQGVQETESSDESDEYINSANVPSKTCRWFPRLCFKSSLCLLNPIPGMKLRSQTSISSTHNVEKRSKATHIRSRSETNKELSRETTCKQKPNGGTRSPRVLDVENRLTCGSNRFAYASDRQASSRTSPFRRSGGLSPYRNEAPQSPFHGVGSRGISKEAEIFSTNRLNLHRKGISKSHELFSPHATIKRGSRPASPTIEKTLYVDTVKMRETPRLNKGSSDIKECVEFARKEFKALSKSREMGKIASSVSSFQETKCQDGEGGHEQEQEKKVLGFKDSDLPSLVDIPRLKGQTDTMKDLSLEFKALVCMNASMDGNARNDSDNISRDDETEKEKTAIIPYPLPPTLPKTPSESWLWRTLPSISPRNPFSQLNRGSSFQAKFQDHKTASANTKWETIVKSSYLHNDHVRYSEELIPHTSQQSKS